jgi:prolyl-tRNA synthetase
MIVGGKVTKEMVMKIVGIGTKLQLGTVVSISREGVVVDRQGKKVTVTFSQIESEVFGG